MDLQFNVESEPRDSLAARANGRVNYKHSHILYIFFLCWRYKFGRCESHGMEVHAEPTFDCRY